MTDVTPPSGPPGPSDERAGAGDELTPEELACGYLDGELAPDDRARVEADPALMALVVELRSVSEAVASPVAPLTDDHRSAMLAAALAALPPAGAASGPTAGPTTGAVTSLDAARQRRSTRLVRTVAGGLAAAAAVGLVALVVTRGGGSDDSDSADGGAATVALESAAAGEAADTTARVAAASAPADTSAADAAATEAPASEAPAAVTEDATTAAPAPTIPAAGAGSALPDLGPLANRREARAATETFTFVEAIASAGDGPCADYPPPVAIATFQGTPAYVVIIETAPDGNRLAFLDQATCAVLVKVDPANA